MRIFRVWDAALPSATPGRVFTSSIGQEQVVPEGKFISHFKLGLKGAVSTAAVAIEAFVDVLSLFTLKVGPETRIQMDGNDLVALMAFYYQQLPKLGENSDNTGNNFLSGVKIPFNVPVDPAKPISIAADRTAVTNIGTETISVTGYGLDAPNGKKPVHAVVVTLTSAAATGRDSFNFRLPPVGRMKGLILAQPAASDFADGNIDVSAQRVEVVKDGEVVGALNTLGDDEGLEEVNYVSLSIYGDLLARYKRFDFREEGFNLKDGVWNLAVDNQDASDALRIIPVIDME